MRMVPGRSSQERSPRSNSGWHRLWRRRRLIVSGGTLALVLVAVAGGVMRGPVPHMMAPAAGSPPSAPPAFATGDADGDGLDDGLEDSLAERFAPIVYHGAEESNFPVSVDWWLARTQLGKFEDSSSPSRQLIAAGPLNQGSLLAAGRTSGQYAGALFFARSRTKRASLFLHDVSIEHRVGVLDPANWVTYVHSYPNTSGGITLQYWRAYAWNDAHVASFDFGHGGDWEQVSVHLDAGAEVESVAFMQHSGITHHRSVTWEGTHPVVYSEEGGHSSAPDRANVRSSRTIRHESWTGGDTTWFTGERRQSGGLVNIGEKRRPRNGQMFIQYAGLWGSPGRLFITSGYWGPAFNETGAECSDGRPAYSFPLRYRAGKTSCGRIFIRAWCDGMSPEHLDLSRECYAAQDIP